jgi:hypothetical protein
VGVARAAASPGPGAHAQDAADPMNESPHGSLLHMERHPRLHRSAQLGIAHPTHRSLTDRRACAVPRRPCPARRRGVAHGVGPVGCTRMCHSPALSKVAVHF